ncbi:MAG: glycosyltransferase family 2 protein [Acidobacteria bacterium]|jgi:glycosyltransferase involved in cell wall biosynthesis|nr:glycosyltransferase family 2 protein [Acidobacteriota bacterium]MBA4123879.1 glycosyltransferase family 2 protein [Acidobacteriota bacterium]
MQKVSVVIPTYNYAHFIAEAVESVLAQTFPIFEIIVVDDGSSDNTEEIIVKFGDKVKYIKQNNGGVGLARNTGVKNSGGEFIAFLDADDIWFPQKIEHQIQLFQTDDKIGLITTGMREFYQKGKTVHIYSDGKNGWCAESLLLLEPVVVGPGSTTLVKREVFEQIGGFDETKELHPWEDWEFCYRVAREFRLAFLPEILVEYRNHGGNGHLQIPRFERAMNLAFEKIFNDNALEIQKLKGQSYGNLHKILAGSYFQNRHYGKFIKHSLKSVWLMPKNISHFLAFPLRRFRRSYENKSA